SALRIAVQAAVRRLTPVLARLSLVAECHRLVTLVPVGLIEPSEEAALFTRIRHAPLVLRVRARNGPRSGLYGGCGGGVGARPIWVCASTCATATFVPAALLAAS